MNKAAIDIVFITAWGSQRRWAAGHSSTHNEPLWLGDRFRGPPVSYQPRNVNMGFPGPDSIQLRVLGGSPEVLQRTPPIQGWCAD